MKGLDIKVFFIDCDGTLTDATISYNWRGEALKRFSVRDGMGTHLLKKIGIRPIIITQEKSRIVKAFAKRISVDLFMGVKNKRSKVLEILRDLEISPLNAAYIGDDINDLEAMKICSLRFCPANAEEEIKEISKVLTKNGGQGCVREACNILLEGKKKSGLDEVTGRYGKSAQREHTP